MSEIKTTFKEQSSTTPSTQLTVCWYGAPIGYVHTSDDKLIWDQYASPEMETLFKQNFATRPSDNMPYIIANLGPDNDIFKILESESQTSYVEEGLRFLSNLTISASAPFDHPTQNDCLLANFSDHINEDRVFTGTFIEEWPRSLEEEALTTEIAQHWKNRHLPRFSGSEIKLPVTLGKDGDLRLANASSFTHIMKFPNEGYKEGWGVNEWLCMQLSEAIGLDTAEHALISMGEGKPPAYLVERFDIGRTQENKATEPKNFKNEFNEHPNQQAETKQYLLHDFCTLAGIDPYFFNNSGKSKGCMEHIAKLVKKHSTNPGADIETLYKRSLLSWAVNDSDMHRKNISMLFEYDTQTKQISSVRMSPTYDVTSEVHRYDNKHDVMLPMAGKRKNLSRKDLVTFGKNIGLSAERAEEIINTTITGITDAAVKIVSDMPEDIKNNEMCNYTAHRIATFTVEKANSLGLETPEWTPVERARTVSAYQARHKLRPTDFSVP